MNHVARRGKRYHSRNQIKDSGDPHVTPPNKRRLPNQVSDPVSGATDSTTIMSALAGIKTRKPPKNTKMQSQKRTTHLLRIQRRPESGCLISWLCILNRSCWLASIQNVNESHCQFSYATTLQATRSFGCMLCSRAVLLQERNQLNSAYQNCHSLGMSQTRSMI